MGQLFGTDGVRGVANTELTPELAVGLGRAVVRTLREEGITRPRIVIGRDPRASGEMLEAALTAGICSAGGDVTALGVLPTPGVAYLTAHVGADSGAMISASHNPVGDNGIKFFDAGGYKLSDAEEQRVEEILRGHEGEREGVRSPGDGGAWEGCPTGGAIGRLVPAPGAHGAYVDHLVAAGGDLSGLRVVVDCAEGAAFEIAPEVLERLGCDVVAIHAAPTGDNINDGCGSTHPETAAAAVIEHGADVGLAHDGDADRLIAVDHTGSIVDGDAILAILAERLHRAGRLDTVVTTVMTNLGFHHAMERLGIEVVATRVGDRYVLEAMREHGYPLGGEQSGHVILAEHATTGDGILTAVQLLTAVAESCRPLAELAGIMQRLPQVLVNVDGVDRSRLPDADRLWNAVAEEEAALGGSGRVLVRASGTEPLVRIMVESDSQQRASEIAERLAAVAAGTLS